MDDALAALRVHYPTWGWRSDWGRAPNYCAETPPAPADYVDARRVASGWVARAFDDSRSPAAVGRGASACEAVMALRLD